MVCGETVTEVASWEGGDSLRDLSTGLGFISDQMSALDPPMEVAEWHDAQIAFTGVFKETIDDYLEDPGDQTEDEFILSMFLTVAPDFQPVEQAVAGMTANVRAQMVAAGCIEEEIAQAIPLPEERDEIPLGGSVTGMLDESDRTANLQFEAEKDQRYLIEVSWEGLPEIYLLIKDPPDPLVEYAFQSSSSNSPYVRRWTAPKSGTFHVDVDALEGTGSYNVSVVIDTSPEVPAGVSAAWEGATVEFSWEPAEGADYYKVYHDDLGPGCRVDGDGNARFCDELASNVAGTTYVHASPDPDDNYYWVTACNNGGCSKIDSNNPASP